MRRIFAVFSTLFLTLMQSGQTPPLTVDPESIVPLPDKFDWRNRRLMCHSRLPAFTARGSEPGTTIDISLWWSGSKPMGILFAQSD
jgi:hypothetical protein